MTYLRRLEPLGTRRRRIGWGAHLTCALALVAYGLPGPYLFGSGVLARSLFALGAVGVGLATWKPTLAHRAATSGLVGAACAARLAAIWLQPSNLNYGNKIVALAVYSVLAGAVLSYLSTVVLVAAHDQRRHQRRRTQRRAVERRRHDRRLRERRSA